MQKSSLLACGAWFFLAASHGAELGAQGVQPTPAQARMALESGWTHSNLQPRGQPVIPVFEGWYRNADGTYDLCFGYHNLNTEQVIEIPLGPDNFIEPAAFDGIQPTRFDPVPGPEREYARRYWCVFSVNVPADFGEQRIVWTLRSGSERAVVAGQRRDPTFSAPGHIRSAHYELDEPDHLTLGAVAPTLTLPGEDAEQGRGRRGVVASPLAARVGEPIQVAVQVEAGSGAARVWWNKHQGSGEVAFAPPEFRLGEGPNELVTTMTFQDPGEYLLRVQAISAIGNLEFFCCWTNGYLQVTVGP